MRRPVQAAVLVAGSDDPALPPSCELPRPLRSSSPIGHPMTPNALTAKSGKVSCVHVRREAGMTEFHSGFVCLVGRLEAAHENEPRLAVPSCHGRR